MNIKCTCGNKGCSTELYIQEGTSYIDLFIEWKEKDSTKHQCIALQPNEIIALIKLLRKSLDNIVVSNY